MLQNPSPTENAPQAGAQSRKPRPAPLPNALAFTVADDCRVAGFGRTKLYQLIGDGRLKVTRAAGRVLVLGDSLRALLGVDAVQ